MTETFTPEQQTALNMLTSQLPQHKKMLVDRKLTLEMLTTNKCAFSTKSFHRLPRGEDWCWNKSRGRISVQIDTTTFVNFHKLNARRMKQTQTPRLKIWLYEIKESNEKPPHLFAFWCERGFDYEENETPDRRSQLTLSDFSFLAEFATPKIANEFGWI